MRPPVSTPRMRHLVPGRGASASLFPPVSLLKISKHLLLFPRFSWFRWSLLPFVFSSWWCGERVFLARARLFRSSRPPVSMSDGTDPAVATHHRFYSDKTKTSSATSETEGGLGSDSESASKMQDTQLVRHPGVRLCGRKVSKLFAVASEVG